ncbi:hydroxyproline O-galactosyltransferase GALT3 [Diospyros lotus]|uniref:hydroxyproline O-galactosyltransferase GALT3 n=1 Tax=Diospyros lotus TaxID=55363 RepID=UPI00225B50EB|nr:hydroxyproline O-galactosyltransferase GALT3 [Diospyros lotus]
MKKWSGGMLILALGSILIMRYSFMGRQPKKQSASDFFNSHPPDGYGVVKGSDEVDSSHTQTKKLKHIVAKKPNRIDVEGLNDLYTLRNISEQEYQVLLAWAQMRALLSRSDALPETVQGIKEGSIAWKELLSAIEEEKISKFSLTTNNSNIPRAKNCPYSISTFNATTSSNGSALQIPCGLVVDSSITLIGISDGHHGSFQIELVGSQLPDEAMAPVIFHCNVCMPGDNLTEEPVIVQNTWTNGVGWGKEERCPDYVSSNNGKVDGLMKCNEQVIRSPVEENVNASRPNGGKLLINGTVHASANFPFVKSNPFAATIWVGVEGFHVTVNGRHETSFAYREKLEPWLVSRVNVGGLDLISALAKGLPVSEDLDLIADVEHLKAPPVSKKRLVMLIGVFSTGNNFERRMALRRSWMQYEAIRSGDVAVRFFIGLHTNKEVNFELWKEAQAYGDIQLMPFVDYYSLLTLKTIAVSILGTKVLPAKYIMKTDDDAFVRIDEVLSSLKGKVSNGLLYGLISFDSSPHRDKDNKWYISAKEWPHASYPPWAHGPGYIISSDIAKFFVQGHQERYLQLFKLEDVAVGIWIEQFKKQGHKVQYISDERFHNAGCESNYILAHYQNPRKVLCLWEKLQKEQKSECCE